MVDSNRRERAEVTRAHLLASARPVFAERGYDGATVALITARAATAHGTFYLYFKNREDVFVHVISDVLDELYHESFTPIGEPPPETFDRAALRQRIAAFLDVMARHDGIWRALLQGALASPIVAEHWLGLRRRFHERLADRWRHLQARGAMRDLDVDRGAYALSSMLEWYALTASVFGEPAALRDRAAGGDAATVDDAVVEVITDLWVHAMGVG